MINKIKRNDLPSRQCLINLISYDELTGKLTWKVKPNGRVELGSEVGHRRKDGYLSTKIKRKNYLVHRLIWRIAYGEDPECDIDHINGDRSDNRLKNLRLATRQQNLRNSANLKNNTTGYKGVFFHSQSGKFRARIIISGKRIHLGSFDSKHEAAIIRHFAETKYFGEYFRGDFT